MNGFQKICSGNARMNVPKEAGATQIPRAPISQHVKLGGQTPCDAVIKVVFLLFLSVPCGRTHVLVQVGGRPSDMSFGGFTDSLFWCRRVFLKQISQLASLTAHLFASQSSCELDELDCFQRKLNQIICCRYLPNVPQSLVLGATEAMNCLQHHKVPKHEADTHQERACEFLGACAALWMCF